MRYCDGKARLYINDMNVGAVRLRGADDSWGFGDFEPCESFMPFAKYFTRWAALMHREDKRGRLQSAAADELREVEFAIDRLHAKLHLPRTDEWRMITQLNIDGSLVEWKEDLAAPYASRHASHKSEVLEEAAT
jgi:hypothetical protein